jgi:uncharacterized protein DUF2637
MTVTDMPRSAAPDTSVSPPPAALSGAPGLVSDARWDASMTQKRNPIKTGRKGPLTTSQKWVVAGIIVAALALAGVGLYLSFSHVAEFAYQRLHFDSLLQGRLFALGVDVGIMVMIAVDLLMAWLKRPISWIRYPVWLLTASTVVLNAASAAPQGRAWGLLDYVAAFAHGVVPILFIMVVELGRTAIDRAVRPEQAERDSIPWMRWVLDPLRTLRMFRRMRLWGIGSYPEMVRRDQELLAYGQWLDRKYGGDRSKATQDELLPMKMAPYGYTVDQALAMPAKQEEAAEKREADARKRRLDAETLQKIQATQAEAEEVKALGRLDAVRAQVEGETGQARLHAQAQVSAAQKVAEREEAAVETALLAEARARAAEAGRKEAEEREIAAKVDLRAAELESQAADKRRAMEEADRVAAAEERAIETEETARARKAAAEAEKAAAEAEKAAAETRRTAAETERRTTEEIKRAEVAKADAEEARKRAAEAEKAAAETRLAAAEINQRAAEAEADARLTPRERAERQVARAILAADGNADRVTLAEIQALTGVSSTDTASKYKKGAIALIEDGYRP